VEGKAASMATIIMLAAPKESRKAYENAAFLLHNRIHPKRHPSIASFRM
jgi:ATP-dependent Clp protease protease subunit